MFLSNTFHNSFYLWSCDVLVWHPYIALYCVFLAATLSVQQIDVSSAVAV